MLEVFSPRRLRWRRRFCSPPSGETDRRAERRPQHRNRGCDACRGLLRSDAAYFSGSVPFGLLTGVAAGIAINALLAVLVINSRSTRWWRDRDRYFALGFTGVLYRRFFGVTGSAFDLSALRPVALGPLARIPWSVPSSSIITCSSISPSDGPGGRLRPLAHALRSWLRAAGERPEAADALGLGVYRLRWEALLIAGALTGLGGAYLTLGLHQYLRRGDFGRTRIRCPGGRDRGSLERLGRGGSGYLLRRRDGFAVRPTSFGTAVSYQLFLALPYALTLLVLALLGGQAQAPSALGEPYIRG